MHPDETLEEEEGDFYRSSSVSEIDDNFSEPKYEDGDKAKEVQYFDGFVKLLKGEK